MMDERQYKELTALLQEWTDKHPARHRSTLVLLGRSYTPDDILVEVTKRTVLGEELGDFLFEASRRLHTDVGKVIRRAIEVNASAR